MGAPRLPASDRFWAKIVSTESGCWIWSASCSRNGYGQLWVDGRLAIAHRFAYERMVGPIPEGLEIDHLCRVRRCVNPSHMEPVTHAENMRRAGVAITHCLRGHAYDVENTYVYAGRRSCKECRGEVSLRRKAARAAA
jgi:uncharacterized protein YcaQ